MGKKWSRTVPNILSAGLKPAIFPEGEERKASRTKRARRRHNSPEPISPLAAASGCFEAIALRALEKERESPGEQQTLGEAQLAPCVIGGGLAGSEREAPLGN
jgi:hypothetical protein